LSSKLKVLFILPNLNSGGAERVSINYLRQLNSNKYEITLLVFNKTADLFQLIPEGVSFVDIGTNSTSKSIWPLLKVISKISPDIVYTSHSRVAALLMVIKPFVKRFKHIARMQGTPSLDIKNKEYGNISKWLFSTGFKSANLVIAQTAEMKIDAINVFGITENKIHVLNNPIDKAFIDQQKDVSASPFNEHQIAAVASGRLRAEKGFDVLLRALPPVILRYPQFKLYILGDDRGALDDIENLIVKLQLQEHVILDGFKVNPYVYYQNCDLFILSSRWEGFPNVLLENYYLNTPIVTTLCVPIVQQLIENGINGFTCSVDNDVELSECIIKCIDLKRMNINNLGYEGSSLEVLFE
jgi:glycosyltransferase involved in cell wall biosynthesis